MKRSILVCWLLAILAGGCYSPSDGLTDQGDASATLADALNASTSPTDTNEVAQVAQAGTGTTTCVAAYIGFIMARNGYQMCQFPAFGSYYGYPENVCWDQNLANQYQANGGRYPAPQVTPIGGYYAPAIHTSSCLMLNGQRSAGYWSVNFAAVFFSVSSLSQGNMTYAEDYTHSTQDWSTTTPACCMRTYTERHQALVLNRNFNTLTAQTQNGEAVYPQPSSCGQAGNYSYNPYAGNRMEAFVICQGEPNIPLQAHRVDLASSAPINLLAVPYYPGVSSWTLGGYWPLMEQNLGPSLQLTGGYQITYHSGR